MTQHQEVVRGQLKIHRNGAVTCSECDLAVPYIQLRHLDYYSDVQFAQCGPCADKNGEYCAVTDTRGPARVECLEEQGAQPA
jgi:hypothetical protein